ncbi:MAG TPA: EamA family transporter [Puia sp.]|nr:EamA family transporter [Puia sp.]
MQQTLTYKEPSKMLVIAAFAAVYIFWGSTYIAIALAIKSTPPFLMAAIRFFVAGIILFIWCIFKGEKIPDTISVLKNSFGGILMLFFGTTTLIWVEQYLPAGLCSIIIASTPFWFVMLDKKHWKENFSDKFIIIGLIIGLAGIVLLSLNKGSINLRGDKMQLISFFALICGTVLWATGSLYSKYSVTNGSTTIKASFQMMGAGLTALIVSFASGEYNHFTWNQITMSSINAMLYLITFGSLVGFIAYVWLLDVRSPAIVGTYAYVNPAVAMFLGWWILNEKITSAQIVALFIILSGVLLVNLSKYKK